MRSLLKRLGFCVTAALILFGAAFAVLPLPGHIPVFVYHFVGSDEDAEASKNFVSAESFSRHMAFLDRFGYRVISLDDYFAIRSGRKKARGKEMVLTFDDGNTSFETEAIPVLKRYRFPVALFLVSESVIQKLQGSMGEETIRRIASELPITVGSHSKTHPFLAELADDAIRAELEGSKSDLERMFGAPVHYLAYPYGDYDERVAEAAKKAGYRLAFTTSHKKLRSASTGPYSLTRTKITKTSDSALVFWFKVSGLYEGFKGLRHRFKTSVNPLPGKGLA